jgi:ketosteroid isomerase-like protein
MLTQPISSLYRSGLAVLVAAVMALSGCMAVAPAEPGRLAIDARATVVNQVDQLLKSYAANDVAAVLGLLDDDFVLYGSDVKEVVRTREQLRQLMADDFLLWRTASFGAVTDLDVRVEGSLASAHFHAPFSAGGRPPVVVRFATTWRLVDGRWRLIQSANTVPTVGQSATELLRKS